MSPPTGNLGASPAGRTAGILVAANYRRGAEVQAERTAEGLAELGWEVEFRSLASSPEPIVGARPLTRMRRSDLGRLDPSLVIPTRRFLQRHSDGIVLAWGSLSIRYVAAAAVALRRRPRLGYVSIGSPMDWLSSRSGIARYRMITRRYDFVIAVSERTKRELVGPLGIPSSKVTVIASGVPERFLEMPRRSHGGPTRVLFIGSLSEEKDPIAAVTVFGVAAEEADLELVVIGDGPLLAAVQDVVSVQSLEERVEFMGSVEDIAPYLAWADVLLLTSRTEGLPGVLIEAAASGLPVVAYDVGAVEEIVEDGSSGIVIHDGTVESAARALVRLASEEDLRLRFGDRAREIVRDRFLLESAVEQTDRLLRDQLI